MAALELSTVISEQLDNRQTPFNVYLDLSKAFDILDNNVLLNKLSYYGFNEAAIKLCGNYLDNRKQYVDFNGKLSSMLSVNKGIPQGSILGPLFFIIYINDLPMASDMFHCIIYADDTTITGTIEDFDHSKNKNIMDISDAINDELKKISNWLVCNKLKLNSGKTKCMCFRTRASKQTKLQIKINDSPISQVSEFNFLGIIFDEFLSWKSHINSLTTKLTRAIGVINRLKHFLPISVLKFIYFALIHSHINYGLTIWGYANDRVSRLQKKAVRTITCSSKYSHTIHLFKNLSILNYDDLLRLQEIKFYYNMIHNSLPNYFIGYVEPFIRNSQYNTRLTMVLNPVYYRLSCLSNSFKPRLVKNINLLEANIMEKLHTHSYIGIMTYCKKYFMLQYNNICNDPNCFACKHTNLE